MQALCHNYVLDAPSLPLGCNNEECFSDTWALDSATDTWSLLVNSTTQTAPRARFTSAGGVYPGGSDLWLSMGQNIASLSRKFSDTWVLRVNTSAAQLTGKHNYITRLLSVNSRELIVKYDYAHHYFLLSLSELVVCCSYSRRF